MLVHRRTLSFGSRFRVLAHQEPPSSKVVFAGLDCIQRPPDACQHWHWQHRVVQPINPTRHWTTLSHPRSDRMILGALLTLLLVTRSYILSKKGHRDSNEAIGHVLTSYHHVAQTLSLIFRDGIRQACGAHQHHAPKQSECQHAVSWQPQTKIMASNRQSYGLQTN